MALVGKHSRVGLVGKTDLHMVSVDGTDTHVALVGKNRYIYVHAASVGETNWGDILFISESRGCPQNNMKYLLGVFVSPSAPRPIALMGCDSRSIHQSTSPTNNRSIHQSIINKFIQLLNLSINQLIHPSINQSINQTSY